MKTKKYWKKLYVLTRQPNSIRFIITSVSNSKKKMNNKNNIYNLIPNQQSYHHYYQFIQWQNIQKQKSIIIYLIDWWLSFYIINLDWISIKWISYILKFLPWNQTNKNNEKKFLTQFFFASRSVFDVHFFVYKKKSDLCSTFLLKFHLVFFHHHLSFALTHSVISVAWFEYSNVRTSSKYSSLLTL